jgi:cytochrome c oxidase subunit III
MSTAHDAHSDDHGHGHHGSPFIQHHYDDAQHQFDSGKLGIWLFLAQEVLFFSALFVAYILYRVHHGEIYAYAHKWLDVKWGAINTAVLIFSSLTAAWAVRCAQLNQKRGLIACIAMTIGCACAFLCIKYVEYSHKYHEQILFGRYFDPCISSGENPMITKSNDCPGAKSTIHWDFGAKKATEGCFEQSLLDLDPREPGVQADCTVQEVKVVLGPDHKTVTKELSAKPITNICADVIGHEAKDENKYPCWKPSYQPEVCPDLTDGAKRSQGAAARPQVGILVLYGDHEHRGHDTVIKADCKKPAPVQVPADPYAAPEPEGPQLGKKLVSDKPVTHHHEHDLLYAGPPPEHTNMFFTIYFAMTGLHGIHVLVGVFVFVWLLIRAIKGQFTPDYFGPVDYAALYWHIVDLIWIFLFPLLYLIV